MGLSLQILEDTAYVSQIVAEIERLRSRINDAAVCELVSSLNCGRTCSVEHSSKVGAGALMGSANYHARVRFHDGSPSWLLRVPRVASCAVGLPAELADYLIRSEYATLKFLESTSIPAPRAFSYGVCGSDHGVGIGFLLIEEMPGRPWMGEGVSGNEATDDEKAKIWRAVAAMLAELEKHPLPTAGSLCFQASEINVSAVASDRFVVLHPDGPFDTATAYYTAFAEQYLALIADGQLYTEYPVDAYLVYRFLKDNVAQLVQQEVHTDAPETFFLKHVDDKGDHLLVDEHLNVTGVIDWQMARVVPRCEAFGPSLVTADMSALCRGRVSLSIHDVALAGALTQMGSPGLADCMANERARRFFWGLALESKWSYALPLANAILRVFGVDQEWKQWRETALRKYQGDNRLRVLVQCYGHLEQS